MTATPTTPTRQPEIAAFIAGIVFAVGLTISGMARPDKIVGFLDFAGAWDASLAFVMIGAIGVHFVAHRIAATRIAPLFDDRFHLPTSKDIDRRLVVGAVLFGVGWGLGGYCPGPAILATGGGSLVGFVFLGGMTIGILLESRVLRRRTAAVTS